MVKGGFEYNHSQTHCRSHNCDRFFVIITEAHWDKEEEEGASTQLLRRFVCSPSFLLSQHRKK